MESIMRIENLNAAYDKKTVLHDISLDIPKRGITAIIGPSGCGKTTLLHCMNGMLRENREAAVSGHIYLGDRDTANMPPEELRRRVGLVFQSPSPFPFSIYKNMTYGLKYYGKTGRKELESAVIEDMLSEMKKDYSIVIVTHNIAQAKRIADEVAVIFDGRLIENGPAAEVFEAPKQQLTREFLAGIYG